MRPVKRHFHRLRLADEAGQPLRAAGAGDDAELDLGLAEFGGVGGEDEIAHHREFAAAAEREARHRGDDRLAQPRDVLPARDEVLEEDIGEALVLHLLDVGAGGEGLLRAGQHDRADRPRSPSNASSAALSSSISARVERVERLRPIEPDQPDPAMRLDEDVGVCHPARLPESARRRPPHPRSDSEAAPRWKAAALAARRDRH